MKAQYGRPERPFYRVECDEDECGWGSLNDGDAAASSAHADAREHTRDTGHTTSLVRVMGWYEATEAES